ncbi:transporter [Lactobacillus sp. Sy-1]|uniref:transporter n=1 Tax=Lactobacillus sp. Sy-1 TaxID=2109645 RepID=UPI001C5A855C|nr:transporter [Lactobacillus sp. Sy-1]MBW1606302.1 transporter [Lactobacillus sp. Sy-1]
MKLKINVWTGIFDIIDAVLLLTSWFVIFAAAFSSSNGADASGAFFYIVQWIGVIIHVIALYKSRQNGISIVGPVLGLIGCALSGFTLSLAFPSIVLLIVATVFLFLQKPANGSSNGK